MASPKKTTAVTRAKIPVSTVGSLRQLKSQLNLTFPIQEGADLSDSEISIKIKGREITAQFFVGGELVSTQAVPVKKIPNPPPMPNDELFEIMQKLRFNFNIKR